ncbi:MAG: ribonuclease P protein component [Patescibacteria group bacterium]
MLPKKQRVGKELFALVFAKGNSFHSPSMSLKTIPDEKKANFSVVAQKSASSGAVGRNKLRRQGYYVLQKNRAILSAGHLSVFFIKKKIPFAQIESEMLSLLRRAGLTK